jgi:hypothetical protein
MCKGLFFLVDGKTQLTCDSADWNEARFPLADGLHRVEWIFKPRSDKKGVGWLDNVSIEPSPVTTYTNHSLNFKIPKGWNVVRDLENNDDTQIVVSDSMSSIRIDILRAGYILNLPSGEDYSTSEYNSYKNNIAKAQKHMCPISKWQNRFMTYWETSRSTCVDAIFSEAGAGKTGLPDRRSP